MSVELGIDENWQKLRGTAKRQKPAWHMLRGNKAFLFSCARAKTAIVYASLFKNFPPPEGKNTFGKPCQKDLVCKRK